MKIIEELKKVFHIDKDKLTIIPGHEGGRNLTILLENPITLIKRVIRISKLYDRSLEDYEAELEFVHYLAENGAAVADVLLSKRGRLCETIYDEEKGEKVVVSMFQWAVGDQIADHGYQYRSGVPVEEYWYNTDKALGKIHRLAKVYKPVHKRFDFFDRYNEVYFERMISDQLEGDGIKGDMINFTGKKVKESLHLLLEKLRKLPKNQESYGMVHFDYSDGNYNIDYSNGDIHIFDFDNCRTCWYMFDLANLWTHGVGWIGWEKDVEKRKSYMERYFSVILDGYRSETEISSDILEQLPIMIQTVLMENIIDEFEVQMAEEGRIQCDSEQAYRIKCLVEDIPYMGFFSNIYDVNHPFQLDE